MREPSEERPFDDLTTPEKILRVQDLWDRIERSPERLEVTDAQRAELDRRLRVHESRPDETVDWAELRTRLERERS